MFDYVEDGKLALWFWVSVSRSRDVVDWFQGHVLAGGYGCLSLVGFPKDEQARREG
jgi:hypothetical protein